VTQTPLPDTTTGLGDGDGAPPAVPGLLPDPVPGPLPDPVPGLLPDPVPGLLPDPVPGLLPGPGPLAGAGLDFAPGAGPAADPVCACAPDAPSVRLSGDVVAVTEEPGDESRCAVRRPDGGPVRVARFRLPADGTLPRAAAGWDRPGT
jgi:hypothetical protein